MGLLCCGRVIGYEMKSGKRAFFVGNFLTSHDIVRDATRRSVSDIFASLTTVCDPDPYNPFLPYVLTG